MPFFVPMTRSCVPSVSATAISRSSSSIEIAMMPAERGLENAVRSVFLIVPARVPMTMKRLPSSSGNAWTFRTAASFSPSAMFTRFAIDLPLLLRPTSGTS